LIAATEIQLDFGKMNGLLPAVVQHHETGAVLMVGFMTREAWEMTLAKGLVTFWSRDRQVLWTKGETSGHVLRVKAITTDCDNDTVLIAADPAGPVCHTGRPSCFFQEMELAGEKVERA
jgi:phosphoribosyl-AMP cyclohydrolase / phosphoribosyl-ATP pyrophosphohydrolase